MPKSPTRKALSWWTGYVCLNPMGNEVIDYRKVSVEADNALDAADKIHDAFPDRDVTIIFLHRGS